MMRRLVLAGTIAAVASALWWSYERRPQPPDVVLVTLDTTRADHLGVYGYPLPTSPEIDAFAGDAVLYTRAWSTAGWTLPSHASMLTGLYPQTHGAHYDERDGEDLFGSKVSLLGTQAETIAESLQTAGYATAAFAGGPWLAPEFGLMQGYQVQESGLSEGSLHFLGPETRKKLEHRNAEVLTDMALDWVQQVPTNQPLHILINYFDPHSPYEVQTGFEVTGHQDPWDREQAEGYDSEIRYMDHHFGRLIEGLERAGRYNEALIIVVADHGETFWEHDLFAHGPWMYEELMHVPLLIRYPKGVRSGEVVDALMSTVDFFPLVAQQTGVPLPEAVQGMAPETRRFILSQGYRNSGWFETMFKDYLDRDLTGFIKWPWKLIFASKGSDELYNLETDPGELENRIGEPITHELRRDLLAVRATLAPRLEADAPEQIDPALLERLRALGYGN